MRKFMWLGDQYFQARKLFLITCFASESLIPLLPKRF